MILVIGGQGAGKLRYVRGMGYSEVMVALAVLDQRPVLADLHLFLKDPVFGLEVDEATYKTLCRKEVIVCNEVGCGLVPVDEGERLWRERVGRVCTRLAGDAEAVVRLVCGIPQYIKGNPK